MKFTARSATRVDLAGGTLDCWPLYTLVGGAKTINLAISISTFAELTVTPDSPAIELHIEDLNYKQCFADLNAAIQSKDSAVDLIRAQLRFWRPQSGFKLVTRSESPVGGGLGGSSSLCISMIKVFAEMTKRPLDTYQKVNLAHNLEAEVLKKPTGTQDYFPALVPGLNIIHYDPVGPRLETLELPLQHFAERMILVYTGQPHHSGLNNWQVIKAAIDGDPKTMSALREIKRLGDEMAETCKARKWDRLPGLFREEFGARIQLSAGFSSPRIEELEKIALKAGADAVKICGAGGGGCVLIWAHPERKGKVAEACRLANFQILDAVPVSG
jgi:D-glycero-alpha-D-manno-heptose-7-phosphate kinase